ncbi:unnamed protein product [Phytophthora fragariaefolia]|uniref:Unnamed protein product n=1 Tax=Phytophthora fragariaefolia TaxID=1490495 RepID=A0A9W7D020_9STRA|nr:unnamed protein product [Phytophthora fragariaefolia]
MDAILTRAGLSAAEQRALCLDTIRGEAERAKVKLEDTVMILERLEEVMRLTRGVSKSQTSLSVLAPDVHALLARVTSVGAQIGPLLDKIDTGLNTPSGPEPRMASTSQENGETLAPAESNSSIRRLNHVLGQGSSIVLMFTLYLFGTSEESQASNRSNRIECVLSTSHGFTFLLMLLFHASRRTRGQGSLKSQLSQLLKAVSSHRSAWPFHEPVDVSIVVDYPDHIKEPVDLQLISKRIDSGAYISKVMFKADLDKMCDNCMIYNTSDTTYYKYAYLCAARLLCMIRPIH